MNNDELVELERLSRTAPKSVDTFLDAISRRYLGYLGRQGIFEAGYPVVMSLATQLRARDDKAPHRKLNEVDPNESIGQLLAIAGLTSRVERMRKLWERGSPLFKPDALPPACNGTREAWPEPVAAQHVVPARLSVALKSTHPTDNQVEQVYACLHLLTGAPFQRVESMSWVRRVAQERLAELIMAQPALLHPRLFWEVSGWGSMVPLAHAMALRTRGHLPSRLEGFSDEELTPFATHPIVIAALGQRSPKLESNPKSGQGQDRTLLGVFCESNPLRVRTTMLASVLQLERLRKAAGVRGRSAIPAGSSQRDFLLPHVAYLFANAWKGGDFRRSMHLFRELRDSGFVEERSFTFQAMLEAPHAIAERGNSPPGPKPIDIPGRLKRQVEALQLVGFPGADSATAAASVILKATFACGTDAGHPHVSHSAELCDVEGAARAISFFEEHGIRFDDMAQRIRASEATSAGSDPGDPWATALRLTETERSMARVIQDTVELEPALPDSVSSTGAGQAPRRRRGASL